MVISASINIVTSEQRIWRIDIEAPKGGDHVLTGHRENLGLDANGAVQSRQPAPTVRRSAGAPLVADEPPFTCADGTVVTIAHLIETMAGLIDRWATADAGS
jgi:hypothetical protein